MTSICPLIMIGASVDVTGHSHSVAIALNNLATDRATGGTVAVRNKATDGGGAVAERGGAVAGRGGVVAEAERVAGPVFL